MLLSALNTQSCAIILPLEFNNPSGRIISISALFLEPDMVGYIVPYMDAPISPSTNMEAAFGRLHNSGAGAFGARPTVVIVVDGEIAGSIYGAIYPTISGSKNGAEIDIILPKGLLAIQRKDY